MPNLQSRCRSRPCGRRVNKQWTCCSYDPRFERQLSNLGAAGDADAGRASDGPGSEDGPGGDGSDLRTLHRFSAISTSCVRCAGDADAGRATGSARAHGETGRNWSQAPQPLQMLALNTHSICVVQVMRTQDARRAAREQKMDLVEVDPRTKPPVCKLLDAGKAQYQAQLKEKVG